MRVAAVVLAAGGSTRFGKLKQFALFQRETFVRHIAKNAIEAGCDPVIAVIGEHSEEITSELPCCDFKKIREARRRNSQVKAPKILRHECREPDKGLSYLERGIIDQPVRCTEESSTCVVARLRAGGIFMA